MDFERKPRAAGARRCALHTAADAGTPLIFVEGPTRRRITRHIMGLRENRCVAGTAAITTFRTVSASFM